MAYGVKYQFSIEATNGDEVDIFLLQRDYSGQKHIRALGRAPILKRERNGCILGTSLEIFAECRVDGEFAELYTSDAYEYKVEVYKRQMLQWTGFVSPELYAEPDIAPPYDVQIIATDGLGELKNYDFAAYDRPKSYQAYIESMLEHTGLALAVEVVSDLQYYDEGWSDANGLESIVVDLSHKAGENCYDVLQAMLKSVNACITQQDGSWTVIRESDLYSWRDTIGSMEFGSMNSCDWWPVGNLNADVIPAKKYLSLTSENHYKPTVLQNSAMASDEGWAKEYNAAYDETEKAYILPDGGSNIRQTANFFTEVGYRLFLHISARNVGDAAESQKLGVMIKINGRMYQAGDEFWLKELADYEGRYAWSNTEGYLEFELPEPSDSETRADASDIEVVIPLYKYDSRSYAYATSLEVMIFNISGVHDIYLYECSLQQYEQPLGHKIEAVIANGARESVSDIELALNDGTYAQPAAEIFRNAIPIAYHSEAIIQKWKTPAAGEGSYLLVMAKDYAMQVALPRMRYRGKLNVPSMAEPVVPLLFFRDGTYYFLNTYSYDLLNDELEVELISIPSAVVSIESEKISEIALPGTASGTGTGGSGVAGGGTSITIDTEMSDTSTNPVQNRAIKAYVDAVKAELDAIVGGDATDAIESINEILAFLSTMADSDTLAGIVANLKKMIQEGDDGNIRYTDDAIAALKLYLDNADNDLDEKIGNLAEHIDAVDNTFIFSYDSTTNKATAEMVAGLASAITANKLIVCNGRVYKFILEQDGMYGLVSDAYMDITDGKLKSSALAVMSSSYDVQLTEEEVPSGNIEIQGGGATPRVEMTAASAAIEPNKFYVWPMMDSLALTLGAEQSGVMNRYLFQFRNPKAGLTMLTLPDTITWSEDAELDENGMPVMEATAFYRIEIIEGLASLKKWKLTYIVFADAEVERVLMANGIGDGIGITKRDAAAVTSFGGTLFRNNTDVTSFNEIIHFKGLETIANGAFYQCVNLVIDILDNPSLSYIGGGAFNGTKLRKISSLGESVTIGDPSNNTGGAFYGCSELTEIAPEAQQSLVYVGGQAFIGTALQGELALANVRTIESGAFKGLLGITAIAIGELCEYIGNGAFYQCSNAVIDTLDNPSLSYIGGGAFNGTKLRKISSLGGVTSLPNDSNNTGGVFANCTELTEIAQAVLDKLTYVASAWNECTNLSINLILPSLTGTYTNGFNNCPIRRVLDLGKITAFFGGSVLQYANMPFGTAYEVLILPDTVESIGRYAFNGSASLLALVVKPATPPTLNSLAFERAKTTTYPIYVPDASVEAYKAATNWNTYASRIKGITELATDNPTLYAEIQQYL